MPNIQQAFAPDFGRLVRRLDAVELKVAALEKANVPGRRSLNAKLDSRSENELCSRRELKERGMYVDDSGQHNAQSRVVSSVATPTAPTDAANKAYVDASSSAAAVVWDDLTPLLTETGTSFTLSATPDVGKMLVILNGVALTQVSAGPGESEYTISGTTITTGHTLVAGESLFAIHAP